ncbi:acyl carrier protein [Amycolatopsis decaplanina]|uniref:Carrier domain-containing protein n=1 Tax=Amycolatopsis decaplanina DSM 44594 TaxID=1284240 RepID=M2YA24_9PSEU|nr:acyl carrier protein [Amycolatopsis decaplanina]EME51752.1 hypothetical protein H074_36254 [Amycolatopsis decaplanina DSM 44594]
MNENFRRLTRILERWPKVAGEDITPQSEIDSGLDIDSINRLELVLAMNKEFGITLTTSTSSPQGPSSTW